MAFNLFGFKFGKADSPPEKLQQKEITPNKGMVSFVVPQSDDGSIPIEAAGGFFGQYIDLDGTVRNDWELITRYREMAAHPEIEAAIDDILGEAIVHDENAQPIKVVLDNAEGIGETTKKKIAEEFDHLLKLLKFQEKGYDIFRHWYVDSRLAFHIMIDESKKDEGIQELRYIDPINLQKIKKYIKKPTDTGVEVITGIEEFFVYHKDGFRGNNTQGIKVNPDAIAFLTSGLFDTRNKRIVGYLHKAIKPLNLLKMMEDAIVIYRITRSPERRIFYVDTGNLPSQKAEQYVKDLMNRHRNKLVYDSSTGEVRDDKRHMSMIEDYWLPRKEGGKGTEITTLPGGCLSMDTKVSLLDGRDLSIKDIEIEMKSGKQLWTYSCHPTTGAIVPGLITWAGVTKESTQVMRITLDNGETIICTPDHKFPIYGKGFVCANSLEIDSSLIPLYKKSEIISKFKKSKYEQIFDNETKKWEYTHRLVGKSTKNIFVKDYTYDKNFADTKKDVIHHKDHNKFNNSPENLCYMNWDDHKKYHSDFGFSPESSRMGSSAAREKLNKMKEIDPKAYADWCNRIRDRMKNYWTRISPNLRKSISDSMSIGVKKYFDNLTLEQKFERGRISKINALKGSAITQHKLKNDPEFRKNFCLAKKNGWSKESKEKASVRTKERNLDLWNNPATATIIREKHKNQQKVIFDNFIISKIRDIVKNKTTHEVTINDVVDILNNTPECVSHLVQLNSNKSVPNWNGAFTSTILGRSIQYYGYKNWVDFRKKCSLHNHRITKIEYLPEPMQVGTLTIDDKELIHNYHTFALSCGVFTKNSNLSEIEDVKYFQKKLYKSLNVPITRLESEQKSFSIGKSTEITRDEVKFSKFITRLRTKFSDILYQLLRTQLILKKVISADEWEKIKDSIYFDFLKDSYFSEMKTSEVIEKKMETVTAIQPYIGMYYSKQWVKKNILRLNDEEIAQIDCEIEEERKEQELNMLRDAGMNADGSLPQDGTGMPPMSDTSMGPQQLGPTPTNKSQPPNPQGNESANETPVDMSVLDNPNNKKKKPVQSSLNKEEYKYLRPRL